MQLSKLYNATFELLKITIVLLFAAEMMSIVCTY